MIPGDIDKLVLYWNNKYYLDLAISFGYVHGSACCQWVTDAIQYICHLHGFWIFNYIDDLRGVELLHKAFEAFKFLKTLLADLGLPISSNKLVSPTLVVTCISISVDAFKGTWSIDSVKLADIHTTCLKWLNKHRATPTQLQSLLGKMLYIYL